MASPNDKHPPVDRLLLAVEVTVGMGHRDYPVLGNE